MIHAIIGSAIRLHMRASRASRLIFKGVMDGAGPRDSIPDAPRGSVPVYVRDFDDPDCDSENMMVLFFDICIPGLYLCTHCCGSTSS